MNKSIEAGLAAVILGLIAWSGVTLQNLTVEFGKISTSFAAIEKTITEMKAEMSGLKDIPTIRHDLDRLVQRVDKLEQKR